MRARLWLAGLALLVARSAWADDTADARGHFSEGVHRFEQGDVEGARQLFLQAEREHHAPVILYNLARCEERLGHSQAAVDAYEKYLSEAGTNGEFAQAAAVAVADVRSRSSRVRIESRPPDGRVFVDGNPLDEPTPTTILLSAGLHHVVIEGDGWRAGSDLEATAGGTQTVLVQRPSAPGPDSSAPVNAPVPPPPAPSSAPAATPPREPPGPDDLVFGGSFMLVPYGFIGASNGRPNDSALAGVDVGVTAEVGYAFAPRAEFLLRGFGALGAECHDFFGSHFVSAGPSISYRLFDAFWVGATLLGGNAATCRGAVVYSTDIVFSPTFDLALAVSTHQYGQWYVSASFAYYFANPTNDNRVIYVPVGFGVRFF